MQELATTHLLQQCMFSRREEYQVQIRQTKKKSEIEKKRARQLKQNHDFLQCHSVYSLKDQDTNQLIIQGMDKYDVTKLNNMHTIYDLMRGECIVQTHQAMSSFRHLFSSQKKRLPFYLFDEFPDLLFRITTFFSDDNYP